MLSEIIKATAAIKSKDDLRYYVEAALEEFERKVLLPFHHHNTIYGTNEKNLELIS